MTGGAQMQGLRKIGREHHLARVLWRMFLAADDTMAREGHVREFAPGGDYVKIAESVFEDAKFAWLRIDDLRLVAVLQESADVQPRPKRKRERLDGEEWKDGGEA